MCWNWVTKGDDVIFLELSTWRRPSHRWLREVVVAWPNQTLSRGPGPQARPPEMESNFLAGSSSPTVSATQSLAATQGKLSSYRVVR